MTKTTKDVIGDSKKNALKKKMTAAMIMVFVRPCFSILFPVDNYRIYFNRPFR